MNITKLKPTPTTQRPVTASELLALAESHDIDNTVRRQVIAACRAFLAAHGQRKGDGKSRSGTA